MSRNGGGYFKDLGNLSQNFFNQIASDIRSNAEQIVSAAFQNESCGPRGVPPDSDNRSSSSRRGSSRRDTATSNSASTASTPTNGGGGSGNGSGTGAGKGPVSSSTSSSQATTPDEVVGNLFNQFVRGGGGSGPSASGGSSSMGNTGVCGSKHTSTVKPSDNQDLAMLCDICQAKFTLFNRKKLCSECKAYFCGTCVSREAPSGQQPQQRVAQTTGFNSRTCKRCKILLSNPPIRADLMELRVKDLQRYLNSKNVNSRSCVEKKDLVELVIRQNGPDDDLGGQVGGGPSSSGSSGGSGSGEQPRPRRMPEERQKSFPKAYVESTHRHEWLEKMENAQDASDAHDGIQLRVEENDQDDFIVVTTSVQPMEQDSHETGEDSRQPTTNDSDEVPTNEEQQTEETPVQPMDPISDDDEIDDTNEPKNKNEVDEEVGAGEDNDTAAPEAASDDHEKSNDDDILAPRGAGALPSSIVTAPDEIAEEAKEEEDDKKPVDENLEDKQSEPSPIPSNLNLPNESSSPISGSPRRFANQGLVYLSEIQTLQDVNELSVKQAKDILAMNRVNFKGVVEKDELLKHVARLWRQEKQAQDHKESMNDSELCKICMDNPVDCVMLECGHMCTCTTCGKQMAECPICRQYVVRVVRTFKA